LNTSKKSHARTNFVNFENFDLSLLNIITSPIQLI